MTASASPLDLERAAWVALSTSGDAATAFYREHLADEVLVVLPGGTIIDDRRRVVDSMGGEPWARFELSDERELRLGEDAAVVTYRVRAQRGDFDYRALLSSTYVRTDDDWRMAVHQQTPV